MCSPSKAGEFLVGAKNGEICSALEISDAMFLLWKSKEMIVTKTSLLMMCFSEKSRNQTNK